MAKRTGSGSLIDELPAPAPRPLPTPAPVPAGDTVAGKCASRIAELLGKHEDGLSFTALRTALGLEPDELREGIEHGLRAGKIRRTGAGRDILYHANGPATDVA